MPLLIDIAETKAFRAKQNNIGNYDLAVILMVTGIPCLTEDNLRTFAQRAMLVIGDEDISISSIMDTYRPYIGTVTNASSRTRADFLRSFKEIF